MNYFTSDTHLGSIHAIIRENRPFKNSKSFDKYIIKLWNKQTTKQDFQGLKTGEGKGQNGMQFPAFRSQAQGCFESYAGHGLPLGRAEDV